MNSRRSLPALMTITILVICVFQLYWIIDNYAREKKTMQIKAGVAFRETITDMQASSLMLPGVANPLLSSKQVIIKRNLRTRPGAGNAQALTMVNSLRHTLGKDSGQRRTFIFTSDSPGLLKQHRLAIKTPGDSTAYDYLVKLEALQDTLQPAMIIRNLKSRLEADRTNIPFTVSRTKGDAENELTDVVVGFTNPVTYHLHIGNTFPYLFTKIVWPVVFSLFLVAVTLFSFVLMYRNILRQQKLADIKNDFISNITHELKTPIATVGVAIEAMKNFNAMDDQAKTKEYLDISSNELQRLGLLVDSVLKISLFEKKQVTVVKETLDLGQVASEVLATMAPQFKKAGAVVNFQKCPEPLNVQGDRLHMMSVIYNLLDNALKYKRDRPVIDVDLQRTSGQVILQVADNGIGIDPHYRSRIFEKFFRVPLGNIHNVKGYGLGLSYVSHIVAQHQGSITLESEVGKGSIFTVKFPA